MQQTTSGQQGQPPPSQVTVLALRGLSQIYEMNMTATRVLLQAQARAARVFGWPDWTTVFTRVDDTTSSVFARGADQFVQTAQKANDAAAELQRQVGRVVETQATTLAQSVQQGLQQLGSQAAEGLEQLCEIARQQADAAERMGQSRGEEMRNTVRDNGEQFRQTIRGEGEQARDTLRQAADETRKIVREAGEQAREGASEARDEAQKSIQRLGEGAAAAESALQSNGQSEPQTPDFPRSPIASVIVSESGQPAGGEERGRRQRGNSPKP
jgi:gas vesicle protein